MCCVLVEVPLLKYTRKPSDLHFRELRPPLSPTRSLRTQRSNVPLCPLAMFIPPSSLVFLDSVSIHRIPSPTAQIRNRLPQNAQPHTMGSKLPEDLKWSEAAVTLLAETEKKSCKSVCITINKACAEKDKKAQASNPWPSARNPHANRPLFYRRTANHLSRREARLKTYTMLSLLAATPALRCPAPMMQTGQGEMTPVGSAPGWAARRGGRFSGGVVPTTSAMATSAMAIHEATRNAEPDVGNYLAPHTAPGAQAPSAESNPQVYSKWLATRNDGGAGVEGALAERAMAEQTAAHLAALRADERAAAERAELDRVEAVRAASERASAERHALATEQKAMADREAADRVAAGRAAAANMHAQRAAKAAEEQAMADQAFAARQAAGKAAAAAWIRGRAP